jgi:calcineurin-like phosphoesterase family protein
VKLLTIFITSFFISNIFGADLSVTPLYFEMQKKKKSSEKFEITIGSSAAATVKVTPFVAKQGLSGGLEFAKSKDAPIIKLEKNEIIFNRKGTKLLKGQINYPKNVNQTLVYALMIEEKKKPKSKGVSINVRYAIVFKVGTSNKRVFEKGSIKDVKLIKYQNKLLLQGTFTNETLKDFQVETIAYVRSSNNKLLSKIELKTASSWKKKSLSSIVFPKTSVYMVGELTGVKNEGNYNITIISRINGKRQFVSKSKMKILHSDLPKAIKKVERITFFPNDIKIKMKPKRKSYFRLKVSNEYTEKKKIKLVGETGTIDSNHKVSIKFFPEVVDLKAGQSKTVLITIENSANKLWQPDNVKMIVDAPNGGSPKEFKIPLNLSYME